MKTLEIMREYKRRDGQGLIKFMPYYETEKAIGLVAWHELQEEFRARLEIGKVEEGWAELDGWWTGLTPHWLPKSQIELSLSCIEMPDWLFKQLGIIEQ